MKSFTSGKINKFSTYPAGDMTGHHFQIDGHHCTKVPYSDNKNVFDWAVSCKMQIYWIIL